MIRDRKTKIFKQITKLLKFDENPLITSSRRSTNSKGTKFKEIYTHIHHSKNVENQRQRKISERIK